MTPRRSDIVLASRGSRLALRQAEIVSEALRAAHPGLDVQIRAVTTKGDRDRRPFAAISGKGLFTSEVEREVVEGRADVAVHSAKDLTADLAPGCAVVCVPKREWPGDVVVGGEGTSGEERLASLSAGATVGTSSIRRRLLVAEARSDLEIIDLRGNLDTRLEKVARGDVTAAILAAAGLARLGVRDGARLDPTSWVPAPSQGALALEAREERTDLVALLQALHDPVAGREVECERAFAARLEGGCSVPLGCLARVEHGHLVATGFLGDPSGGPALRDRVSGPPVEARRLGQELAGALLASGGDEVVAEVLRSETPLPSPP